MKKLESYFKNQLAEKEEEQITKVLLANHFDRKLENRWRKLLESKHQVVPPKKKSPKSTALYWKIGKVAASIALLIVALQVFPLFAEPTTQDLLVAYLDTPYEHSNNKKGVTKEDARMRATDAYNRKDYPTVIRLYQQIINAGEGDIGTHFYLGLSYLYDEQILEAIQQLTQAYAMPPSNDIQDKTTIAWYLSLAYLKNDQVPLAKDLLEKVVVEGVKKQKEKARELLQTL